MPRVRTLLDALIEPAPPPLEGPACPTSTPAHRLRLSGEIALGLTITLLALGLYGQTMAVNQRLSQRFGFCQPPRSGELSQSEAARQTQSLISNLTYATPSQKVRLAQQANGLVAESARLCRLAALNHGQEAGLMTVATAALCLLTLTVVLGLAHGLMNTTNRTLRTLRVTAVFLLVVPMVFLQLGDQVRNGAFYLRLYLDHHNLYQQLLSALANQDLPVMNPNPNNGTQRPMRTLPPLGSSARVAELIRALDLQLQALPPIPLTMNDSGVIQVFHLLTNGWKDEVTN
ncbi:MAG: hypothetical protein ACK59A_08480 [Cyanobacteriota bacterium]